MSGVDEDLSELAIDAFALVHRHLYLTAKFIRHELQQQIRHDVEPEHVALSACRREISRQMEHDIEPERLSLIAFEREMNQQMKSEIEPLIAFQREICYDFWRQCCILRLLCKQIMCYAHRAVKTGYEDEQARMDMAARAGIRLRKRLADKMGVMDEQRPLKILHGDFPSDTNPNTFDELVEDLPTDTIPNAFDKLVDGMHACALNDDIHKEIIGKLMVYDPKRKLKAPSRFCSFHLDGFDLDAKSIAPLGPAYQPADYAAENAHQQLASYSIDVVSIRVIKAGPRYTYPVEVYGKIIARDQIDYKCVNLFDRERKNAQTIKSEKDMLALTGPSRALVTLGYVYFEFDLKIKGEDGPDDDVPFSKGVISYFCRADRKRIILQLPSFESTVKLVLQHVDLPLAASIVVSVEQGPSHPLVPFKGKITAGTTRNYRQHTLLYDSSVGGGGSVREDRSLELNHNVVAVNGYVRDPVLEEHEKLVLYVCFLDAGCEIEDEDWIRPAFEDEDEDEDEGEDEGEDDDDEEAESEAVDMEEEDEVEENPKNVVTLKYPLSETVWEHGCPKLRVKVDWTAVLGRPKVTDFFYRQCRLPKGCSPNYQWGIFT